MQATISFGEPCPQSAYLIRSQSFQTAYARSLVNAATASQAENGNASLLLDSCFSDPRVIVLDESTSSLDVHSEHKVQRALENLLRDRTVIVIAHRISTVTTADKVAVVSDGCIAEFGRPSELQEASSVA